MAIINKRITLLSAPNGDEQDVIAKQSAPVKILETKDVDGNSWARIQLIQGDAMGWVPASFLAPDQTPDPSIKASDFARQCWWVSAQYGTNPYYMTAVAELQSNLSNDQDAAGIGPFRFTQAEWDAYRANPQIGLTSYTADDISEWEKQCIMYGVLMQNSGDALVGLLPQQPSWIELFLSQLIGAKASSVAIANPGATIDKAFTGLKPQDISAAGLTSDQILDRYSAYLRDKGPPPRVLTGSEALDAIAKSLQESLEFVQKTVDDVAGEFVDAENTPSDPTPLDPKSPIQSSQKGVPEQGSQKGVPEPKFRTKLAQNEWEAYHAALGEGLRDVAARALVANMMGESLLKPSDHHMDVDKFGRPVHMAQGIVQWDPGRAQAIADKFGKQPMDMTVAEQTRAAIWEIRTVPRFINAGVSRAIDTEAKAEVIIDVLVRKYEAPAFPDAEVTKRIRNLQDLARVLNENGLA